MRRLTVELAYDETLTLPTKDGSAIELRRLPSPVPRPARPRLPPVLLVHGLAANHRNQDVVADFSLARHLAGIGRDVWLLTLRSGLRGARDVRFAAMARFDLTLAVATVRARARGPIDYVGFSMGGMLLYAALGRGVPVASLRRAVLVGSPGGVSPPLLPLAWALRAVPRRLVPRLPLRFLARMFAFASEWLATPFHHAVVNPGNVAKGVTRRALVNVIEDVPGALGADFVGWAARGGELTIDGDRVLEALATVETPALFVAGSADRVAPIAMVRRAFDAWGRDRPATRKRFVVLGRDFGQREDYGHGDLALGAHVGLELFEPIARFLGPEAPDEPQRAETGPEAVADVLSREATREPAP